MNKTHARATHDKQVGIHWDPPAQRDAAERAVRYLMGVFAVYNVVNAKPEMQNGS